VCFSDTFVSDLNSTEDFAASEIYPINNQIKKSLVGAAGSSDDHSFAA
jgi:hypothetical protein